MALDSDLAGKVLLELCVAGHKCSVAGDAIPAPLGDAISKIVRLAAHGEDTKPAINALLEQDIDSEIVAEHIKKIRNIVSPRTLNIFS